MSPEEFELLVHRLYFFNLTADEALQILRDNLDKSTFGEIYTKEQQEWAAAADTNPLARFPLDDRDRQEAFFRAVEDVCRGVDKIQEDYPAYVPLPSPPVRDTTARQARPRGFRCIYGRARYHVARTLISHGVALSFQNRPRGDTPDVCISLLASSPVPSNDIFSPERARTNAKWQPGKKNAPATTMLYRTMVFEKPSLWIGL